MKKLSTYQIKIVYTDANTGKKVKNNWEHATVLPHKMMVNRILTDLKTNDIIPITFEAKLTNEYFFTVEDLIYQ